MPSSTTEGRARRAAALAGLVLVQLATTAAAEELVRYKNFSTSVPGRFECQPDVQVRIDAPNADHYTQSRVDRQDLADVVRSYLWIDCPELASITFTGHAADSDDPVFQARAAKAQDWFLQEGEDAAGQTAAAPAPSPPPEQPVPDSLAELEAAAAAGDDKAQLALARGLLDKAPATSPIDFPEDRERAVEMLEKLASEGNAEAMQLLAEAYLEDAQQPINFPLVSKITGKQTTARSGSREEIAAQMSLAAAAKGSKEAVKALNEAGKSGSSAALYALGSLYAQDGQGQMPYDKELLEGELGVTAGQGASDHGRIGLEILQKAARAGSEDAQQLLTELGMGQRQAKKEKTARRPGSGGSASARNLAKAAPRMVKTGTLDEILEAQQAGAAAGPPRKPGQTPPQSAPQSASAAPGSGGGGAGSSGQGSGGQSNKPTGGSAAKGRGSRNSTDKEPGFDEDAPLIID